LDFASDGTDDYVQTNSNGVTSEFACFSSAVELPQRSKVKRVTFYYASPAGDDFYGDFTRKTMKDVDAGDYLPDEDMANRAEPEDDSDQPTAVSRRVFDDMEVIDNANHEYVLNACPLSGRFFGARVKYTYRTAGD
jgi:hypothetical protein